MSGHNPHSRVSQPVNSSSWNHLQVPPYARQPQLAHMSSDRALRSSPLIWPNTNPADAFYNYMALTAAAAVANSNPKNTALDMNPLLPFVRAPTNAMPFNSVDLSLSSTSTTATNRNSLTPSPRNQISPGAVSSSNRYAKHTSDADECTNNGANKMDNKNSDPIAFLNEMSEQLASMRSNRNLTTSSTIPRDLNSLNSDLSNFRNSAGNDKSKQRNEPIELVKEPPNATNPFENESLSQSVHLQQLLGLAPPVTSSITSNLNDLSKSLLSIFNNTSPTTSLTSSLLISPKSSSNFLPRQSNDTSNKNCLNTSNDDSLDSQSASCNGDDASGKSQNTRYRRRKPQKTVRMSNELNATDSLAGTVENNKNNTTNKNEHKTDAHNSNGINFVPFHSEANSILPSTNAIVQPPQTQSMDLSHHHGQEMFENGLVNYNKSKSLNLTNSNIATDRSDKDTNLLQTDDMNSLNLFGGVNFSHLRGTNLTNDIATFPNTDDLVKKVEELVKCNEQNGFGNNDFGPVELIKSHANKLDSDEYESNRLSNGIGESMKATNNIEHINSHPNEYGHKHNGNGIIPAMISNSIDTVDNKTHENTHDNISSGTTQLTVSQSNSTPNSTPNPNPNPNPNENGELKETNIDTNLGKIFNSHNEIVTATNSHGLSEYAGMSSVDMMYEKMSNEVTNQTNLSSNFANDQSNVTANTPKENSTSFNSNDLTKEALSASSSEAPSNRSSTSAKKSNTKKKTTNRCNGKLAKSNAGKNNQKTNAKSKDKCDKKSDINEKKKTKSMDESSTEVLNKFRGPYVHVGKDGTLEVFNAPLNEEIAEKQSKFKKNYISQRPADRNKVRGLHVSTLSIKYDAVTTDISWMCVFCKLGPHKYGLGDLFGPFILSTESEDFQLAQIDPKEDLFKSHRNKTSMAYSQNRSPIAAKSMSKSGNTGNVAVKKKRKLNQIDNDIVSNPNTSTENVRQDNEIDIFYGMTQASDCSYEVWAHEDCIVWASGVHIIGARVVGLETAVWGSVRHQCSLCKQYGAMLSCLQRSCSNEVHVPCAKRCDWNLDEHCFQSRCSEHSLVGNIQNNGDNTNN